MKPVPIACTFSFHALHAPKDGNTENEYEDAYAPAGGPERAGPEFTVALSDGASSAVFARQWARLLVDEFASKPWADQHVWEQIAVLGRAWKEQVASDALPWYAQEKLSHGSHASLLVVRWDVPRQTWSARALGDTCLFVVRQNRLIHAFPLARSAHFNNTPVLVSTEIATRHNVHPTPFLAHQASFEANDRFLLMTDALASWFLQEFEARRRPWENLPASQAALPAWLQAHRADGRLKNDDVTLVEVRVEDEQKIDLP